MTPTLTFFVGVCLGWLFASLCAARKTPLPHSGRCDDPECWCHGPEEWAEKNGSQVE